MVTSYASHCIERLGNCDGKNTALACIESLTPLVIPVCKIRNRAGLTLKSGDAPLNSRLGKRQMLNLSLSIAVGYARDCDVNNRAKLTAVLYAKNRESRVRLVCGWRECPDLTGAKLGCGWSRLLGATTKEEGEQTHSDEKCFGHAVRVMPPNK